MKLSGIRKEETIQEAVELLFNNLSKYSQDAFKIICGGKEEKQSIEIFYSDSHEFWWGSKIEESKNKYWNPVGFGRPNPKGVNRSDCEFNCALKGFNGNSSLFAKDHHNNTYLLHSGKAGGNTAGTTIDGFCEFYQEKERSEINLNKESSLFL